MTASAFLFSIAASLIAGVLMQAVPDLAGLIDRWRNRPAEPFMAAWEAMTTSDGEVLVVSLAQIVDAPAIAVRLGFDASRVDWRDLVEDFPAPVLQLAIGPIWQWSDVASWCIVAGFEVAEGEELDDPLAETENWMARRDRDRPGQLCTRCAKRWVARGQGGWCAQCNADKAREDEYSHQAAVDRKLRWWTDHGEAWRQARKADGRKRGAAVTNGQPLGGKLPPSAPRPPPVRDVAG